jgi:hypothetical protein
MMKFMFNPFMTVYCGPIKGSMTWRIMSTNSFLYPMESHYNPSSFCTNSITWWTDTWTVPWRLEVSGSCTRHLEGSGALELMCIAISWMNWHVWCMSKEVIVELLRIPTMALLPEMQHLSCHNLRRTNHYLSVNSCKGNWVWFTMMRVQPPSLIVHVLILCPQPMSPTMSPFQSQMKWNVLDAVKPRRFCYVFHVLLVSQVDFISCMRNVRLTNIMQIPTESTPNQVSTGVTNIVEEPNIVPGNVTEQPPILFSLSYTPL